MANDFIEQVADLVKRFAPQYGICVYSPIIAQAILESAMGTSELAVNAHNYFGLKYKSNVAAEAYVKVGSEQNQDGTYYSGVMLWCKFPSIVHGVKGYFDFISAQRYSNLKGVTDPKEYLVRIKADGYATSLKYVDNLLAVIDRYDLTRFDGKKVEEMSNSSLVNYTKLSPNRTSPRNHKIDTITIHHMAGNLSVESCGNVFAKTSRKASSNYGIGTDGRIGLYVEEKDRSWCSSNKDNDHRAVTIEVANDNTKTYTVSEKAISALINLCADICKRNGIEKLVWSNNKSDRINHRNGCNMTVHRDFAATACPGEFLFGNMPYIAEQVNKILNSGNVIADQKEPEKEPASIPYLVKITASELNVRAGAGTSFKVTTTVKKNQVYTIVEEKMNGSTKWGRLKSGAGWISLKYTVKC